MATSKSPYAYEDIRTILDRALESPRGVAVKMPHGQAVYTVQRLHQFRLMERTKNAKIFSKDDPRSMGTAYDILSFRVPNPYQGKIEIVKIDPDRFLDAMEEL